MLVDYLLNGDSVLLRLGKENLYAWWVIVAPFCTLVGMMMLLTFIGDALRDAFDTRKS